MKQKILIFIYMFLLFGSWTLGVSIRSLKPLYYSPAMYEILAKKIFQECSNSNYKPSCYDKRIPLLMSQMTMEQAFDVTRKVQEIDKNYQYCHVLGHELSAIETRKNLSKWKDVISRCPSGMCSNGCIHGAFQERFRTDKLPDDKLEALKPELAVVCEKRGDWVPTGMEQASCYHALGHLLMYITDARAEKATAICDELTTDFRSVCYDGVFMQIFQPLEPEDFALIKGKELTRESVLPFCNKYTGQKFGSCWSESWPLFREDVKDPQGLIRHCSVVPLELQSRCYNGLLYVLIVQMGFSEDTIEPYCRKLESPYDTRCFAMTASRFIETDWRNIDKAIAWCKRISPYDPEDECYKELALQSSFTMRTGSKEQKRICDNLPERIQKFCSQKLLQR